MLTLKKRISQKTWKQKVKRRGMGTKERDRETERGRTLAIQKLRLHRVPFSQCHQKVKSFPLLGIKVDWRYGEDGSLLPNECFYVCESVGGSFCL